MTPEEIKAEFAEQNKRLKYEGAYREIALAFFTWGCQKGWEKGFAAGVGQAETNES